MQNIKAIGAAVATAVTAGILIWWLVVVAQRIGVKPEVDAQGNVVLDQFGRAKDILLVVLPLFTAGLAYFVGAQGATQAKKEADGAKDRLDAVLDVSGEGALKQAMEAHPEAFRRPKRRN